MRVRQRKGGSEVFLTGYNYDKECAMVDCVVDTDTGIHYKPDDVSLLTRSTHISFLLSTYICELSVLSASVYGFYHSMFSESEQEILSECGFHDGYIAIRDGRFVPRFITDLLIHYHRLSPIFNLGEYCYVRLNDLYSFNSYAKICQGVVHYKGDTMICKDYIKSGSDYYGIHGTGVHNFKLYSNTKTVAIIADYSTYNFGYVPIRLDELGTCDKLYKLSKAEIRKLILKGSTKE